MDNNEIEKQVKKENPGYRVSTASTKVTVVDGTVDVAIGNEVNLRMTPDEAERLGMAVLREAYKAKGISVSHIMVV